MGFALSTYELKYQNMGVATVELQLKKIVDIWHSNRKITTAECLNCEFANLEKNFFAQAAVDEFATI